MHEFHGLDPSKKEEAKANKLSPYTLQSIDGVPLKVKCKKNEPGRGPDATAYQNGVEGCLNDPGAVITVGLFTVLQCLRLALEKVPKVAFDATGRLGKSGGYLRAIKFCFIEHACKKQANDVEESLLFCVWQESPERPKHDDHDIIFEEKIIFDQKHFMNLVNLPPEKEKRNDRVLQIAQRLLGQGA